MIRTGSGFDAHRFVEGRPLILGGVRIDYPEGLQGHSDADVLTHAVCDAILGAAALGDIGKIFPDTDEKFLNISSIALLEQVRQMIEDAGYRVVNVDATVVAAAPKIAPHSGKMIDNLARALQIEAGRVSVKATTTESLGFTGRGEGIAAFCSALIESA